ncbi:MAG: hypothetical protein J2P25_19955, partial [Nocardiopsaceae bacterium]|nr:hypothetical protein [Nocardiopsaceae bacterium]
DAAAKPHRQAYDPVTGKFVTVYRPAATAATPARPEKLTHPQGDDMGTITSRSVVQRITGALRGVTATRLPGIDVSSHQGTINWGSVAPHVDFVYAKATEGTYYTNPDFGNQYNGSHDHGLVRGAYHFAIPNNSSGAAQADFFVKHGGGWSAASKTLPGALDIEYNPYGKECYGLSRPAMTSWIRDFVDEYAFDTGVFPVIYTPAPWWKTCTGNATGFQADPLWIPDYSSTSPGTLPGGYLTYAIWQYAAAGPSEPEPGDQDYFNGDYAALLALAGG